MMKNKLIEIIEKFEANELSVEIALQKIENISGKRIDEFSLKHYLESQSLDDFVNEMVQPVIENWKDIDDEEALNLINEIYDNLTNNSIVMKNSSALEKHFSKPTGTITDMIFYEDIDKPEELLKRLKIDTRIIL